MSRFERFLSEIEKLRERTARFWRVALHLHSIDSYDWGRPGDKLRNDRSQFEGDAGLKYFLEQLRPHFDLAVVTDHMKCGYACQLSMASMENDGPLVLPGMEVNFRAKPPLSLKRFHLLVILPEGSTKENFAQLFSDTKVSADNDKRQSSDEIQNIILSDWIKHIDKIGGICIAAHIDGRQGYRTVFRQAARNILHEVAIAENGQIVDEREISDELREYLFSLELNAIELTKSTDGKYYRWYSHDVGRSVNIPVVMGYDAHCVEQFDNEDKCMYFKMTKPCFVDMKEALVFPDTRIRFGSELIELSNPQLMGMEIVGSEGSIFIDEQICFSRNLNCLIGPRGSGKSSIVEAMRYAFGYNRSIDELDAESIKRIRAMQQKVLSGCAIRIIYKTRKDETYIIESIYDPKRDYNSVVYSLEGDRMPFTDVERCGEFPLRLFGWSEIESLGRDQVRQRELLDRLAPALGGGLKERAVIREEFVASKNRINGIILKLLSIYNTDNRIIEQYSEYKNGYDRLNTDEMKTLFSSLDSMKERVQVCQSILENIDNIMSRISEISEGELEKGIRIEDEEGNGGIAKWWEEMGAELGHASVSFNIKIRIGRIISDLKEYRKRVNNKIEEMEAYIGTLNKGVMDALPENGSVQVSADNREGARQRLDKVTKIRAQYIECLGELENALNIHRNIGKKLEECQNGISRRRKESLEGIEELLNIYFDKNVRISLAHMASGDNAEYKEYVAYIETVAKFSKP